MSSQEVKDLEKEVNAFGFALVLRALAVGIFFIFIMGFAIGYQLWFIPVLLAVGVVGLLVSADRLTRKYYRNTVE